MVKLLDYIKNRSYYQFPKLIVEMIYLK